MTRSTPAVSVVVATHRRAANLPRIVAGLDAQTLELPYEIVIVNDGSDDDTRQALERLSESTTHPLVAVHRDESAGPATARNTGWRTARGELVAFTDDDCVATPGWLEELVARSEGADIVLGRTEPNPEQLATSGLFSKTLAVPHETGFFEACNVAYRRSLLERLGGFDERFALPAGEDTDLGWRAVESGATTAFAPGALVYHDVHPSSYVGHLRSIKRWSGVVEVVRLHPQLRSKFRPGFFWLPHQAPAALGVAGGIITVVSIALKRPIVGVVGLVSFVPYLDHRLRVRPLTRNRKWQLITLPFVFVADALEALFHASLQIRPSRARRPAQRGTKR